MTILPECPYRVNLPQKEDRFLCRHTSIRARGHAVTAEVCWRCSAHSIPCDHPRIVSDLHPSPPQESVLRRTPLPGRLAVLACYFNPCGYSSTKRNYARFRDGMDRQGIDLFTIELAFGDAPFFLEPHDRLMQVRAKDVLWQKERLLNLLMDTVPSEFDKIAWVDADLIFTNPLWTEAASRLLEVYPVVQLFEQAVYLTRDHQAGMIRDGVALAVGRGSKDARHLGISHPGFAWAARRSLLSKHGLLDNHVVGGGDSLMVHAMYGWWDHAYSSRYGPPMKAAFLSWAGPFFNDVRGRVGHVPGRVLHLWHGDRANRKYNERIDWLRLHAFDPLADIALDGGGLWRWATVKPALHDQVRRYFFIRREDD